MKECKLRECKDCGLIAYIEEDLKLFKNAKTCKYGKANLCLNCKKKRQTKLWLKNSEGKVCRRNKPNGVRRDRKEKNLKFHYGIKNKEYWKMFQEQQGQCSICGCYANSERNFYNELVVDHCHKTGKVRGLLCSKCNTALGFIEDSKTIASNMVLYLT